MEPGIDSFAARFDDAGLAASPVDRVRANEDVAWSGEFRPPLTGQGV